MSPGVMVVDDDVSVTHAALVLADSDVGAVPVRGGADGKLKGMLTDRDIVVKVVAAGKVPASVMVGEVVRQEQVLTVGIDDGIEVAIETMKRHKVRRQPVLNGHEVAGMITQADNARSQPPDQVADLLEAVSS